MYLSTIHIKNFRGIEDLRVKFHEKLNVIIGPNACFKTTLIDAIRLFYGWGDPNNDQEIGREDFFRTVNKDVDGKEIEVLSDTITIVYDFLGLSASQRGAYCHYLAIEDGKETARVTIEYHRQDNGRILRSYYTGMRDAGQKADYETFQLFKSYYLSALRDSTRDLMSTKNNLLGKVIKRKIDKNGSAATILDIIQAANNRLLEQTEVDETKCGINTNLRKILNNTVQQVGLNISQNKVEYIVNVIKPFIPISNDGTIDGYRLWENSLGYNNLIYIATVLSDIRECHIDDSNSIFALFIEEPEAHLHPQLQVNLYNFLKGADDDSNSQTFITTHSPTLASRIPLENLILLKGDVYCVADCFENREQENIKYDVKANAKVTSLRCSYYKNMLMRYLDVTRSQLFFSKGALFVEGISESLLLNIFSKIMDKCLTDNEIELVDMGGTAFGQFLMLFNSSLPSKRLPIHSAFVTDADQFTDSKSSDYDLDKLIENNYGKLNELRNSIETGIQCSRVANMMALCNGQDIYIGAGKKTLEFQIAIANVHATKNDTKRGEVYKYLKDNFPRDTEKVDAYMETIEDDNLSTEQQYNVALLLWKCMPNKSQFAQDFAYYLQSKFEKGTCSFAVPKYIKDAINFLIP